MPKGRPNVIKSIQEALGTEETGLALVEVARRAHRAEQELVTVTRELEQLRDEQLVAAGLCDMTEIK